jgi:hypothetical protein
MASVGNAVLPLRGLLYIIRHRVFPVQTNFMPVALNAAGSLAFLLALYTKGWSLQRPVVYGALGSGMLGFAALQALLAVEAGAAVYAVLQRTLASASTSMFDAVLAARGVKQVKQFSSGELADIRAAADRVRQQQQRQVQQLGLPARLLRFAIRQVGKRLVTAPLMLIPGVGWAAYVYTNAMDEGASCHQAYFRRKGINDELMRKAIVSSRSQEYTAFGAAALVLNLIPVLNYFLSFGNAAGAALWAADIEMKGERWLRSPAAKQE